MRLQYEQKFHVHFLCFLIVPRPNQQFDSLVMITELSDYLSQFPKNIKSCLLGQIFRELFSSKISVTFTGTPVCVTYPQNDNSFKLLNILREDQSI